LHRVEPVAVGARPVAHHELLAEGALQLPGHLARIVDVLQPQLHAGGAVGAKQPRRIVHVNQRERTVVFVVAGVEGTDHGELLQPRHHAAVRCQSGSALPCASNSSTCAITLSMRPRTSFWKPFITDSTMISAATPSAMPSIDTPEMKEMKRLRRPARPARV